MIKYTMAQIRAPIKPAFLLIFKNLSSEACAACVADKIYNLHIFLWHLAFSKLRELQYTGWLARRVEPLPLGTWPLHYFITFILILGITAPQQPPFVHRLLASNIAAHSQTPNMFFQGYMWLPLPPFFATPESGGVGGTVYGTSSSTKHWQPKDVILIAF